MNFHTAELFICPPYHQKIVCREDPVIIILLRGLSKRERVREEGIEQLSLVQRRNGERGRGKKGRERFFTRSFRVMYGSSLLEA